MTTIASLDVKLGADAAELTRTITSGVGQIHRFADALAATVSSLPSLDVNTDPLNAKVAASRAVLEGFVAEARDLEKFPDLSTAEARREVGELITAFTGLDGVLKTIDPTGMLRRVSEGARAAASEVAGAITGLESAAARIGAAEQQVGAGLTGLGAGDPFSGARASAATLTDALNGTATAAKAVRVVSGEPVIFPTAPAVAAADTLIAKLGVLTRTAENARQALSAPSGPSGPPVPVLLASQDDTRLAQNATANAAAVEKMGVAQNIAGQEAAVLSKGLRDNIRFSELQAVAATQAAAATDGGTRAFGAHRTEAKRAVTAIAALAATSVGAEGPLGRLAETGILFGAGITGVVAASLGLLGAVTVFDAVTKSARLAKEETDKAIASLLHLREAQRDPVRVRLEETGEAAARVDELRKKIIGLTNEQRQIQAHPIQIFGDRSGNQDEARLSQIAHALVDLGHKYVEASNAVATGTLSVATEQADQLAEAIRSGTASLADFTAAAAQIAHLNELAADGTADLSAQNDARRKANALIEATQVPLLRQLDLQQRLTGESVASIVAADGVAKAQAQVASGTDYSRVIAQYRALEAAAAGDVEQVQRLADKRHEIELLAKAADDAIKAFANIGGAARDLPVLQFKTHFDFSPVGKALLDTLTGQSDAVVGGFLTKLLGELQSRSRNIQFADINKLLNRPPTGADGKPLVKPSTFVPATVVPDAGALSEADKGINVLNGDLLRTNQFWAAATERAEQHRKKIEDSITPAKHLNDVIHETTRGLADVAHAASNVGLIGKEAEQSIGSVLDLADALGNVAEQGLTTGNVLALIGAGISILGAAFGKSQADIEHEARLVENTRAIEHNTVVQGRQGQGLTSSAVNQGIDDAIAALDAANRPHGKGPPSTLNPNGVANDALARSGLDVQDLAEIARRNHIELLDSKGNIDPEALKQFNAAVDSGQIQLLGLADSAAEAANSLLNVPEGFKIAKARFDATQAVPASATVDDAAQSLLSAHPEAFHPTDPRLAAVGAVSRDVVTTGPAFTGNTFVFQFPDVKDGRAAAKEAVAYLRDQAMATTGRSIDVGEVNV